MMMPKGGRPAPPWLPGQSGNPGGRPRTSAIDHPLRALLEAPLGPEHPLWPELTGEQQARYQGMPPGDAIAIVYATRALAGDLDAAKWIAERAGGRAPTASERMAEQATADAADQISRVPDDVLRRMLLERLARLGVAAPPTLDHPTDDAE